MKSRYFICFICLLAMGLLGITFLSGCTTTKTVTETETETEYQYSRGDGYVDVPAGYAYVYRGEYKIDEFTGATAVEDALAVIANPGDDIIYVGAGTYIASAEMTLNKGANIRGADNATAATVILSGNDAFRVFQVTNGKVLQLANLTVANGYLAGGNGAGILITSGSLIMDNVVIRDCDSDADGGAGLYIGAAQTATIRQCTFQDNTAGPAGGIKGGAIYDQGTSEIYGTVFKGNSAQYGGAIYVHTGCTLNANNNIFNSNNALNIGDGGAVYLNSGSDHNDYNSVYYNNSASGDGGGLFSNDGLYDAINNIFWGNTAAGNGAQVYSFDSGPGNVNIMYSCVQGGQYYLADGTPAEEDITGPAFFNTTSDPSFVDAVAGNFRVQSGSPCIDTGFDQGGLAPVTDIDGTARPQGADYDMGAYER